MTSLIIQCKGKSVLCSSLVNFLQQDQQSVVLVYFCSYLSSKNNDCTQVLRSLVAQILRTNKELACYIFDDYISQGLAASVAQLRKLLPALLDTIASARIIIDGLDENDQASQRQILSEILPLTTGNVSTRTCKVIISSREVPQISRVLAKRSTLSLAEEKEAIRAAIHNYVHHSLAELQNYLEDLSVDLQLIQNIEDEIVKKADGKSLGSS